MPRVARLQGAFEGQKAYRTADGRILLFRPDENAQRLQRSADRMCMLAPSQEEFIAGVEACVKANLRWVRQVRGSISQRAVLVMADGKVTVFESICNTDWIECLYGCDAWLWVWVCVWVCVRACARVCVCMRMCLRCHVFNDPSPVLRYLQVPPAGKGSLYIRALLFGSGPVLGLAPAPEFTFMVYVSPVGNYFKVRLVQVDVSMRVMHIIIALMRGLTAV